MTQLGPLHMASHPPGGCPGLLHMAKFRQNHSGLLDPAEKAAEQEEKAQQSGQCLASGLKPEGHNGSLTEWSSSLVLFLFLLVPLLPSGEEGTYVNTANFLLNSRHILNY